MLFIDNKDSVFCILCLQARDLQTTAEEQYRQELAAQTRLADLYKVCVSHLCRTNIGYFVMVVSTGYSKNLACVLKYIRV